MIKHYASQLYAYDNLPKASVWPSQSWDLTDPKERKEAAKWVADLIENYSVPEYLAIWQEPAWTEGQ